MTARKWVLTALGLLVVIPASQMIGRLFGEEGNANTSAQRMANVGQSTQVLVSRQSSEGVVNADLNVEAAERLGEYTLERMRHHTQKILDEMQSNEGVEGLTQKTVLASNGDQNVVVTRIYIGELNNAVAFMAISNDELIRVLCQSNPADHEVVLAGKCRDTVKQAIGYDLVGGDA